MPDSRYRQAPALPYQTKLSPDQEREFQNYAKLTGQTYTNLPDSDYDLRGQWLAGKQGVDPGGNWTTQPLLQDKADGPHGSDVWKTPYHRTFSNESKYAISGRDPRWNDNAQLVTPTGAVVADESANEQKTARQKIFNPSSRVADTRRWPR